MSISLDDQMIRRLMSKHWENAPREKFRGQRAHFRRLFKMASSIRLPDSGDCSCLSFHVDWEERANYLRLDHRDRYLSALGTMFRTLALQCERSLPTYEIYIILDVEETGYNAVHINTPDPDDDDPPDPYPDFPFVPFADVYWNLPKLTLLLESRLGLKSIRVGYLELVGRIIVQSTLYGVQAT